MVNQQGILAIELVIRNNMELIRGVDRATNVTVSALQVAVTLALALANQKIVLEKIQAVNETTDKLIAGTAERLRTQGAEIHKMAVGHAASTSTTLKKAFVDIRAALDDISRFRQEALPQDGRRRSSSWTSCRDEATSRRRSRTCEKARRIGGSID